MRRLVVSITLCASILFLGVQSAWGQAVGVTGGAEATKDKLHLYGFGGSISFFDSSGLTGPAESYENQIAFFFVPTWQVGKLLFKDSYFKDLTVSARLLLSYELAGNDASFRGQQYASPALFAAGGPEAVLLTQNGLAGSTPGTQIEGTRRHAVLSDTWLNFDKRLYTIPKLKVGIRGNLRQVFPTSILSRNVGLRYGISPSVSLSRAFFKGKVSLAYITRFTKFFFANAYQNYTAIQEPVQVNGYTVDPYRPETTGALNPEWSVWNALSAGYNPIPKLSISALFLLIHSFTYRNTNQATVDGVPLTDLCTDGPAVGDVNGCGQRTQRDSMWFQLSVGYDVLPWLNASVGLSTFQPVRRNGLGIQNPFLNTTQTLNVSTVFFGASVSFDALYASLVKKK